MRANFFKLHLIVIIMKFSETTAPTPCHCTQLPNKLTTFKETVLVRRTRSIVFPNKGFLLLTPAFTKAILDGRPRGLAYSIEFDMYSPLPDTIEGWQPTILIKHFLKGHEHKPDQEEAARPPPAPAKDVDNQNPMDLLPQPEAADDNLPQLPFFAGYDYSPGRDQFTSNYEPYDGGSDSYQFPLDAEQRMDDSDDLWLKQLDETWSSTYDNKLAPYLRNLKRSDNISKTPIHPGPYKQFHRIPIFKQSKRAKKFTKHNFNFYERWSSYGPSEEVYRSHEEVPKWKYHQGYRERREIFNQLEAFGKIFNFDMKACIKRAMCEVTTHLRPYGESLMDDIVRIVLTISEDHNFNDEYIDAAIQIRGVDCEHHFAESCPYQVLELLIKYVEHVKFT